jgi:exopolyphosphatase / guanosine-5'-triphosphate,3'-diphosphate pyrophosphatase
MVPAPWQTSRVPTDPMSTGRRVGAAIDLGSNSVHLLVAELDGHDIRPIVDESVFLGLGLAVAERGHLGVVGRSQLSDTVARYASMARDLGSPVVTVLGTEPIRRAADAATIVHDIDRASSCAVHILSHEEEALLNLIGVTDGRPAVRSTLVVDIGGGSSEFSMVEPGRSPWAAGLQLGSARLTDRYVTHDPPTAGEIACIHEAAAAAIKDAPHVAPSELVAVGGSATNLPKIRAGTGLEGTLSRARLAEIREILASTTIEAIVASYGIKPTRARLLSAGAEIIASVMDRYGLDEVGISEAGIREGAILAVAHAGPAWRDRLVSLAGGWRT